jgi:hypothetical protein
MPPKKPTKAEVENKKLQAKLDEQAAEMVQLKGEYIHQPSLGRRRTVCAQRLWTLSSRRPQQRAYVRLSLRLAWFSRCRATRSRPHCLEAERWTRVSWRSPVLVSVARRAHVQLTYQATGALRRRPVPAGTHIDPYKLPPYVPSEPNPFDSPPETTPTDAGATSSAPHPELGAGPPVPPLGTSSPTSSPAPPRINLDDTGLLRISPLRSPSPPPARATPPPHPAASSGPRTPRTEARVVKRRRADWDQLTPEDVAKRQKRAAAMADGRKRAADRRKHTAPPVLPATGPILPPDKDQYPTWTVDWYMSIPNKKWNSVYVHLFRCDLPLLVAD